MKRAQLLVLLFSMMGGLSVSAMQVDPDPRTIISPMDRSVSPELDILRVTADVSPDKRLVFQVKTGENKSMAKTTITCSCRFCMKKLMFVPVSEGKKGTGY